MSKRVKLYQLIVTQHQTLFYFLSFLILLKVQYNQQYVAMSKKQKPFFLTSTQLHSLENNLIEKSKVDVVQQSLDEIQSIFMQNKVLNELLDEEHLKSKATKQNIEKTKKRIAYINVLNGRVNRETFALNTETQKIKDVLALNKLLMMEKLLRLERETAELKRKKEICNRAKTQKHIQCEVKKLEKTQKLERVRLQSLHHTVLTQKQLNEVRCQTMEVKKRQAEEIKKIHERQRSRSKKIDSFKRERARLNYLSKIEQIKIDIDDKQQLLQQIVKNQSQEEAKASATIKVTSQYLNSFFATQAATL